MQTAPQCILVVDDDEDIRDTLAMALETMGQSVETAADGLEVLHLLSEGLQPSLIFLDLMMPRMDGEAVLEALRKDAAWRKVPVIVISGDEACHEKAAELQADSCLRKPFEYGDVSAAVKRFAGP